MDLKWRRKSPTTTLWVVEVWDEHIPRMDNKDDTVSTVFAEPIYTEISEWCYKSFGYHARTAYHIFELRKKEHLDWFLLKWS